MDSSDHDYLEDTDERVPLPVNNGRAEVAPLQVLNASES